MHVNVSLAFADSLLSIVLQNVAGTMWPVYSTWLLVYIGRWSVCTVGV